MDVYAFLPKIQPYVSVLLGSFAFFNVIHLVAVPLFANLFFPTQWAKMNSRARNNWAIHICSQAHALVILPLAWRCIGLPELDADRAFGWHERNGTVQAIACGYFIWDTLDAIVNYDNIGFVLHGLTCGAIYLLSFIPFLGYFAPRFLLWETSTLFLNIHWALDKTNRTGGSLQLINGVLLVVSFALVRLVAGGYWSYQFYETLFEYKDRIPLAALVVPGIGNVILQGLNWFWFTKMISSLRKRFSSKEKTRKQNGAAANGHGKHQKAD
ncbi:TLC domain-containing protein [Mycena indigotica]|uniref:TLC domain-containing protein n=1 Tax=Mycena indigotica TaxID=2126181 RepID=A0A8H6SAM3_9AGAR|nr:TLC domain-containing protein [Mycena indigotica]KAF7295403.1 TLC domain-containing protein [Mycena indigotica]